MSLDLTLSGSLVIHADPSAVYALVADVTRMGEWSPVCTSCWWDEGAGPSVGAWFTGRNQIGDRVWETRSQVVAADPGREFAFEVAGSGTRWAYTFRSVDGGTEVTESWMVPDTGVTVFRERFGEDDYLNQLDIRKETARTGIAATLAAIKAAAEG